LSLESFFLEYALAVKIRLKRTGMPKQASYRIVVAESVNQRDGAIITNLGYYSPYKHAKQLHLEIDLYNAWVAKGAKPSEAVKKLVRQFEKRASGSGSGGEAVKAKVVTVPPLAAEVTAGDEPAGQTSSATSEND